MFSWVKILPTRVLAKYEIVAALVQNRAAVLSCRHSGMGKKRSSPSKPNAWQMELHSCVSKNFWITTGDPSHTSLHPEQLAVKSARTKKKEVNFPPGQMWGGQGEGQLTTATPSILRRDRRAKNTPGPKTLTKFIGTQSGDIHLGSGIMSFSFWKPFWAGRQ